MRQYYNPLLISIIIVTFMITSGLLLFGTIDATQIDTSDCEEQFKRECPLKKEVPKPHLICPNPRQPCTLDETETVTTQ